MLFLVRTPRSMDSRPVLLSPDWPWISVCRDGGTSQATLTRRTLLSVIEKLLMTYLLFYFGWHSAAAYHKSQGD
jgi:hypothetical protein